MNLPTFKTERVAREWRYEPNPETHAMLSPTLREIVSWAAWKAYDEWAWAFVVTEILRTPAENAMLYRPHPEGHETGVHVVGRGVDVRAKDRPPFQVGALAVAVNERWVYDPARPAMRVCLIEAEGPGSNEIHAHFQVSPTTIEIRTMAAA